MRFVLNKEVKDIIRSNYRELKDSNLDGRLKNFLYKNRSIDYRDIETLVRILDLNRSKLNLKKINLNLERNFGPFCKTATPTFSGKSEEFAEFIGIILGDGNIYKNSTRIIISKEEIEFSEYIMNLFYRLFGIKLNRIFLGNRIVLGKHNEQLVNILLGHGLKRGNKVHNQVGIPPWVFKNKGYIASCLRGLIDTDGCLYKCKREGKNYIQFTNHSINLLDGVKELGNRLGIKFSRAGNHRISIYKKEDVKEYIKGVGFSNPKHKNKIGTMV